MKNESIVNVRNREKYRNIIMRENNCNTWEEYLLLKQQRRKQNVDYYRNTIMVENNCNTWEEYLLLKKQIVKKRREITKQNNKIKTVEKVLKIRNKLILKYYRKVLPANIKKCINVIGRFADDMGNIYTSFVGNTDVNYPVRKITKYTTKDGYEYCSGVSDKATAQFVHRLIYEAFCGKLPEGYEADHINFDRSDNRLVNLRCITIGENRSRRQKHFQN